MSVRTAAGLRVAATMLIVAGLTVPAAAGTQPLPPYAHALPAGTETIGGVVEVYDGHFAVTLDDDRGFVDTIKLHNGTQIDPEGVRLHRGERVIVHGHADGGVFDADVVALDDSAPADGNSVQYTDDDAYTYSTAVPNDYGGAYDGGGYYGGGYYGGGYSGGGYGGSNGGGYPPGGNGSSGAGANHNLVRRTARPAYGSSPQTRSALSGGARSAPAPSRGSSHR